MENALNPKTSKCWNCEHGLCVAETNFVSAHFHPHQNEHEQKPFADIEETLEVEDDDNMVEQIFPLSNIKAYCFWKGTTPMAVGFIEECNRYQKM